MLPVDLKLSVLNSVSQRRSTAISPATIAFGVVGYSLTTVLAMIRIGGKCA